MWSYNFPRHKRVPRSIKAYERQAEKMVEEAKEALYEARRLARMEYCRKYGFNCSAAIWDEVYSNLRRETCDCIHASETLLRAFPIDEVYEDAQWVIRNNEARGYYGKCDGGGKL